MQSYKIILLGSAYPYRGGIAAFNERLCHEFQAEGHRVEICTFTLQYPSFLFPGKTQYSVGAGPSDLAITRQLNSVNPFNWLSVGRALARRRPDYLLVPFWMPFMAPALGTVARVVRRLSPQTRVVALLHNLLPHERRIGDKMFARYFVGAIDACVSLSKSVLEEVAALNPQLPKAFYPHPLYDNFGTPVPREEACRHLGLDPQFRYLLFFGLIRDYKGLDWLLEAFADARLRNRGVKLIVAGEFYVDGEKYRRQALESGIGDDIVWCTEFVPDDQVRYYFGAADLVVQPYKTATQSGVTQIAYHFGKPMLVTRVGGLAEIVPDGRVGYAVEPQVPAIADALADFFCCDAAGKDFSEGIREEKKKYSWSKMTHAFLTV